MKLRVFDGFCKAGGAGAGYVRAGLDLIGMDIEPQSRNPHVFGQGDVMDVTVEYLRSFDLLHFSPPCQYYTELRHAPNARNDHWRSIPPTRALAKAAGVPYIIENVRDAAWDMESPVMLCGSMFGLGAAGFQLQRHRLFETSFPLTAPPCQHKQPTIGVYGGHVRCRSTKYWREGGADFPGYDKKALAMEALGIDWPMTMEELSEAVPPAFAEYVARQFLAHRLSEAA